MLYSTEVTSSKIISDTPLYARTRKAYEIVQPWIAGNTLEIGCGEGYGIDIYKENTSSLTLIDKSSQAVSLLRQKHPKACVIKKRVPELTGIPDNSYDSIIAFQVIEHLDNDRLFLNEIHRVLKPGGKAYITTPNKSKTIVSNPWHYREYNLNELNSLLADTFGKFDIKGIKGNAITDAYYANNKASVTRILQFDLLKLHRILPDTLLKVPYELLNRINRLYLLKKNPTHIQSITSDDYQLDTCSEGTLDFFCVLEKRAS